MAVLILTTILTLSALYAPQPLLPVLTAEFGGSREAAAFLTTVTFIPLCLAPLVYGYWLESFAALVCRGGQRSSGLWRFTLPYHPRGISRRACSGLIATCFGWRYSFLVLAASLLLCFFLLRHLPAAAALSLVRPRRQLVFDVLRQPGVLPLYLMVFCLFLSFAAVMNFLPFRLTELHAEANELRIGLMYSGYAMGIVSSLGAVAVGRLIGGERRTMALGLVVLSAALLGLGAQRVELLFADMFLFCVSMFLVHATASGLVNRLVPGNKGMVNGLYVAFYYGGGTLGSYLPGYAYRYWGW